jgi:hypothetical protein
MLSGRAPDEDVIIKGIPRSGARSSTDFVSPVPGSRAVAYAARGNRSRDLTTMGRGGREGHACQ